MVSRTESENQLQVYFSKNLIQSQLIILQGIICFKSKEMLFRRKVFRNSNDIECNIWFRKPFLLISLFSLIIKCQLVDYQSCVTVPIMTFRQLHSQTNSLHPKWILINFFVFFLSLSFWYFFPLTADIIFIKENYDIKMISRWQFVTFAGNLINKSDKFRWTGPLRIVNDL